MVAGSICYGVVLIVIGIPFLFLLAKRNASKTNLKKED